MAPPRAFPPVPTAFRLRAGTSFCETGGEFIFLDTLSDRYVALRDEERASFARLLYGTPLSSADHERLSGLASAGLLSSSADGKPLKRCCARPAVSSLADQWPSAGPAHVAHALARLGASALGLQTRPLQSVLDGLAGRKARIGRGTCADLADLRTLAGAFAITALVAAPLDRCLSRSVALAHAMIDRRLLPDLIIGVRLHPFGAHCLDMRRRL